jgi:hypothetical protein
MNTPSDPQLFALSSEVVKDGLAFVERAIATGRTVKPYENWPTLTWAPQYRVPDFSFASGDAPRDYKDLFTSVWPALFRAVAKVGLKEPEEFEFGAQYSFQRLKEYLRSQPTLRERFGWDEQDEGWFEWSVKYFIENLIDRYIHFTDRTTFDTAKFLSVYLPFENGVIVDNLPIKISVPILMVHFPWDSREITDVASVQRIPETLQLARARNAHDTHEANEHLIQQATHSLVLSNYELPNQRGEYWRHGPTTFPLETIDAFFAALRIAASVETGYGQLLIVPIDWAHRTTAYLPPIEGTIIRAYPPDLRPVSPFYGNDFASISEAGLDSACAVFKEIMAVQDGSSRAAGRLKLAIKRLNSCYLRENEEDAILDATIGLEVLLSDGDTQEITHKLALRLAALASLVPKYAGQSRTVFRNVKNAIYPFRSAVVHGSESKANKNREIKSESSDPIPVVKLATEYLGMAIHGIAARPEFLDPALIDQRLLLRDND